MKHAPVVALALAATLVVGCGGGGSSTSTGDRVSELEDDLAAAQQAAREAEAAAEAARLEAERQAAAAQAAEQQRLEERARAEEAEREAAELEEEAKANAQQLVQANARQVFNGLVRYIDDDARVGAEPTPTDPNPDVTPRYRESALVTTDPTVTFSSITTGTSGNWFRTSFSHRGGTTYDRLDVYSDAESPDSVPFRDSTYKDETAGEQIVALYNPSVTNPTTVVDDNRVVGSVLISATAEDRPDAASSAFPRSGDPAEDFDQTDRGQFDAAQRNDPDYTDDDEAVNNANLPPVDRDANIPPPTYRNMDRYPLRYTYETGGSLGGASGTYTCASNPAEVACRVTNQNDHFRFVGPWVFTPSSATSTVRVEDSEFMHFGWWARQANLRRDGSDGSWTFRTFHGPTQTGANGNRSSAAEISKLSGTATYVGPAAGQYSFYQPEGGQSDYGKFSATATLRANFEDEMVDGTIDQFTDHPDWTLTLKHRAISDGVIAPSDAGDAVNSVSWQIDGEATAALDSGTWEAAFYSNLPAAQRTSTNEEDAVPTGMAGTFEAEYENVGRIIGAFGAHKQ